ncbi:hypothetical protein J5226_13620 [Lysobacter sp. K5869]|uniref:hypothetical protein n=1 Tax=Lysobacter sp. K5869 TaxID=2820808 RepID=UPI001C05EF0B|nr:hypothetical protein [Lysobacter sp. K5869]QWP74725.1 hypothetical protein J5226_13620 [Lysobacter sp. K5869]
MADRVRAQGGAAIDWIQANGSIGSAAPPPAGRWRSFGRTCSRFRRRAAERATACLARPRCDTAPATPPGRIPASEATLMEETARPRSSELRRRGLALLLTAATLAAAPAALASGHLPGQPIEPKRFPDYAACKAFLEQTAREDRALAEAQPRDTEPGTTRQVLVISDGVVERGPGQAEYRVQTGPQFRRRDEANAVIVTNFSYDERSYRCSGGELSGETGARGFYQPGYEAIPAPAR